MTTEVRIRLGKPHPGQALVMASQARHKVVRCGRRWGKSFWGEDITIDEAMQGDRQIGWFCPESAYLEPVWRSMRSRLAAITRKANDTQGVIELINGSVIEAWTLKNNNNAGRSRKYHLSVIDEAGLIPSLMYWWQSALEPTLIDYAGRSLWLSTPNPIGPDFDTLFERASALSREGNEWAAFTGKTLDNTHLPQAERDAIAAKRGKMPDWLWCQEYEGVPAPSGAGFFGRDLIAEHRALYAREPDAVGSIRSGLDGHERDALLTQRALGEIRWRDEPRESWSLWMSLNGGRPPQEDSYVMGVDLSAGVGASNTVFSIAAFHARTKVAEYACPRVTPEEAARIAIEAALWFGGRTPCVILPEANGPGEVFIQALLHLRWPAIGSERKWGAAKDMHSTTRRYGWRSTEQAKQTLLGDYRACLKSGRFIEPSHAALDEALTYHFDQAGRLVSSGADSEDPSGVARAPHGDRTIASALAALALDYGTAAPVEERRPPPGTVAERIAERERAKRAGKRLGW